MKFNTDVLKLWGKWFLGLLLGGIVSTGKTPLQLSKHEWLQIANTIWASAAIVVGAWLNPKHPLTMTTETDAVK